MAGSNQINAMSINFTRFPQNLLIPSIDNIVSFQATNLFNSEEKFLITIKGENLNIRAPEQLENEIQFGIGENKTIDVSLIPSIDGYGKLIISVDWLKLIELSKRKKV